MKFVKWIKTNRIGLFIGAALGFIASKILYGPGGSSRGVLADLSRETGLIDSWLSYDPQTIAFIKITIVLILFGALIGGFAESKNG